jgi:hypothetical protein
LGGNIKAWTHCYRHIQWDYDRYTQILQARLLPPASALYPSGYRLQQDNDPKHCARYTRNVFEENGVNWWPTTPESPDFNPIENVWGLPKEYSYKPK